MLQSGGLAARPDGSTSESVTCGGSDTTWRIPRRQASATMMIAIRTSNEVSTDGRRGQECSLVANCRRSLWAFFHIKSRCVRIDQRPARKGSISTMAKIGKPTRPLLGAHMSIAGEVGESLIRGKQVGCECIQIFTKSSRQWASKPYTKEEIDNFQAQSNRDRHHDRDRARFLPGESRRAG